MKKTVLKLRTRMFKFLEEKHFQIINDIAYFHKKVKTGKSFKVQLFN